MMSAGHRFSNEPSGLARFQHVIFPDLDSAGARHVINFTPDVSTSPVLSSDLSLAEDEASLISSIFRRASVDFRSYRPEVLKRRLPSLLRALRVGSIGEAR